MGLYRRDIFAEQLPKAGQFSPDDPSETDPSTGEVNSQYRRVPVAPRYDASGALDTSISGQHGDVAAYRLTSAKTRGIDHDADSNDVAGGMRIGRSAPSGFHTTGHVDGEEFATTSGEPDRPKFSTRGTDEGTTGAGKAVL
jgi:hypothetical protein